MDGSACLYPPGGLAARAEPSRPPQPPSGGGPTGRAGRAPGRRNAAPSDTRPSGQERRLRGLARAFITLYLEVEAGRRPRSLLRPLMCPLLYARLCSVWVRGGCSGAVVRVYGSLVSAGSYEAVAVVRRGERVGAVAVRLHRTSSGWRVDDAVRPEDGPLPDPPYPIPRAEPDVFDLVLP